MRAVRCVLAGSLLLIACPGEPPRAPPPPPVVVDPPTLLPAPRADGRLPPLAAPTRYSLDLDVDPTKPRFGGAVRIALEIPKKTSFIVLHATNLDVSSARVELGPRQALPARASTRIAASATPELVLAFPRPLPPGQALLVLEFSAPFDDALEGLYRVRDGDRWYAFTQLEATAARRAFPCFDEPAFKVPFELSVTVPRPMIAVANAPEASREEGPDRTRFRFQPTRPLPTHLVALAVGELEVEEHERFSRPPLRVVTTKGKTALGALALEAASGLVDALADWLGTPYPYDKLDLVAVPALGPDVVESAGLVALREDRVLLDPSRASVLARRAQARAIAHGLAHQWLGDLVTASWWSDRWLDEGLATWMDARIVDRWRPELGARLDAVVAAHAAMDLDGLASARAIRRPVVSTSDARETYDAVTHDKGAAVLAIIERWIGEGAFQSGVRAYVRDNVDRSVQAERLLSALEAASGKDVTRIASPYLDDPGVPEVSALLECEPGARWHVELSSQPWRPLGAKVPEQDDRSWTIPVCLQAKGDKQEACADLVAGAPSLVAGRGACPAFVYPSSSAGYFRFTLTDKGFVRAARARKDLDLAARTSLLSNAWAAVRSGALEPKALLEILPAFDDDPARLVADQVVDVLFAMSDVLVDDDARAALRSFARARLAKRKKALGWAPPPKGDASADDALARRSVLLAMGDVVEDEGTLREAEEIATRWLHDPASVDADAAAVAVDLASRRAGDDRLEALLAAAKGARSREDRLVALRALMGFDDEARLGRALARTLGGEARADEAPDVIASAFARRRSRPIAEAWVRARWDELRGRLPGALARPLVRAAGVGCSDAEAEERAAFYGPRLTTVEGAARGLSAALESIALCAALRERAAPPLRRALLGAKR